MSTSKKKFSRFWMIVPHILLIAWTVSAQAIDVNIRVKSSSAVIEGKFMRENFLQSKKNWSFSGSPSIAENLGARVSSFELKDKNGGAVNVKKFIEGEYVAESAASSWTFQVDLKTLTNPLAMAHDSWVVENEGILMLDDLLPQMQTIDNKSIAAKIKFELPVGWKIISSEKQLSESVFEVSNVEKAIFLIGKSWRERDLQLGGAQMHFAVSGDWNFTDDEAAQMAGEIFEHYRKLFGANPTQKAQIALVHFPKNVKFGRWEAETRGASLTILSSDMPFKTLSLQRLHEQLRHEIFHLWIPNNLALTGNYDWFYEGFTVYESLKTAVQLNQIRFEDFLATLSEAYNIDNFQTRKASLIEASKNRWNGANPQVYSRGMVTAFLCDLALLRASKGRRSLDNVFREIYDEHHLPNEAQNGNTAILKILNQYEELRPVVEKYVSGAKKINWQTDLESAGIEAAEENSFTKLRVKAKLSGRQKNFLDDLGYNNWRKIVPKTK